MDAVQQANSGHPGTPMALAPLAHVLFTRIMKYDAADPDWPDRDRFVLSAGHASMLLYSMLYLTGFGLELDDLRAVPPVGLAHAGPPRVPPHARASRSRPVRSARASPTASASAIAEAHLRAALRRRGRATTTSFAICGDGDLEEGISHEAASLAGHLGLGRLVYVYDDNHITIDGPTELAYSDDVPEALRGATAGTSCSSARSPTTSTRSRRACARAWPRQDRPTLLVLRSHIGYPSPKYTDTAHAHGNPLGADEVATVKEILGLPAGGLLRPRRRARALPRGRRAAARAAREAWEQRRAASRDREPELADEFDACLERSRARRAGRRSCPTWTAGDELATRAGVRRGARRDPRRRARPRRRRRRPHRQHRHRSSKDAPAIARPTTFGGRQHPLRHPRARHGRGR